MKKAPIIIFLILIVIAVWFLMGKNKSEAPMVDQSQNVSQKNPVDTKPASNPVVKVPPTTTTAVKEFTVTGKNFSFDPSIITVKKGDKVKITFNNTQGFHNFVIDEFGVATKQVQSPDTEVLEFIADKVGSFEYYCAVGSHRAMGMKGTLKVE